MAGDFQKRRLGELCSFLNRGVAPAYVDSAGLLVLNQKCIRDQRVVLGYARRTDPARKPVSQDRLIQPHDILVNSTGTGTLGRVAQVRDLPEPATVDSHVTIVRPNPDAVDPVYLGYVMRWFEPEIEALGEGSTGQTELSRARLRSIEIPLPGRSRQRAIAHILGTLDDKIEVNRRMSETLEEMARALFESWFVRFDPVRAKMEGRDPGLPSDLADLFSDRLVDSELGEIPEGWEVARAGDIFSVAIGKTPPRKEPQWFSTNPKDVRWMSIKDLGSARVFISRVSEYLTHEAVERFRVRIIPDCTVVLSFKLTVGRVAITDGKMVSNEAIAHFLPRSDTYLGPAYLYLYLRNYDYESLGSTSSIATAVNSDSVREIRILVPTAPVHETFHRLVWPWFLRVRELQRESRTLAALRDTLLPKLISGELPVKDAERLVAAAT